ncbi:MAG: hypothetical protein K2R98_05405 [Gemmataceae bacterium]|nr:hypothetical protein [Gemmataceae bacterium]
MPSKPLFKLGQLLVTPGALEALQASRQSPWVFLTRHIQGDYGDLDAEDKALNALAVQDGSRLLSAYTTSKGTKLWLITEADRSATTILLPDEY